MGRIILDQTPFFDLSRYNHEQPLGWGVASLGHWPVEWVDHARRPRGEASVVAFRLRFNAAEAGVARVHVSADNRYRLWLDGVPVGRGPERGDPLHWRYESYELEISAGAHTLLAESWWLGELAPLAQMSVAPGFLLAAEGAWQELLSTGAAPWEAMLLPGIEQLAPPDTWATGAKVCIHGEQYAWGWESGVVGAWESVMNLGQAVAACWTSGYPASTRLLTPATLPAMIEERRQVGRVRYVSGDMEPYPVADDNDLPAEHAAWQAWVSDGQPLTLSAHTRRCVLLDLENYYCAYPEFVLSGGRGSRLGERWAEALFEYDDYPAKFQKGNRNEVLGKYFHGEGNSYLPDGGAQRCFSPLWWGAGRYLELTIVTEDEPLTLESFSLLETRYPLEMEGTFHCADARLDAVIPLAVRSLQMCAHETYMDCPYYEQLMYVGDTRLEVLITYVLTRDDRLPRKAIQCFNDSRLTSGLTTSRFPSRETQIIPPFSLWWVGMVYDHWRWRDAEFARAQMPAVRGVLEAYRTLLRDDGLLAAPIGWNFMDWVKEPLWAAGVPIDADLRVSSLINLQFALILTQKAAMEEGAGEPALAQRDRDTAWEVMDAVLRDFWDEKRGLIADELTRHSFSEHAQCLALLSGLLPTAVAARVADGLLHAPDLARTTIYFSHYLFETLYQLGNADRLFDSLALWFNLERQGFKTTFEEPGDTRSDCHAWGAHPLYHCYATLLGIRPSAPAFSHVRIAPLLGDLAHAHGIMPHPLGNIEVSLRLESGRLHAAITLPPGLSGEFCWKDEVPSLHSGRQQLTV